LLGEYDAAGLDVAVNFGVGCQLRDRTTVKTREYRPAVTAHAVARSGSMFRLAGVEGSRALALGALFIRRAHVRMGRNGLWHLRSEIAELLSEPVRQILTHGRTGTMARQ
jgi:hypothetical protein